MKNNVLIIFGGKSYEHDISIVSTFQVLKSFDEYLYNIQMVYIDINGDWRFIKSRDLERFLKERESAPKVQLGINDEILYKKVKNKLKKLCLIDIVFPIVHGINCEDGILSGLLKMSGVPFVGCDNYSSSIGINKDVFKKVCGDIGVLKYIPVRVSDIENEEKLTSKIEKNIGFPCIVKPNRLGSSIGINCCKNKENLIKNIKNSLNFDKKVLIEPYIENLREFNVALFSYQDDVIISEIEEPFHNENILSFYDKYMNFSEQFVHKEIPVKLSKSLRQKIISMAKNCYAECGCSGVVRVDFIYDSNNKKLYLNEINTIPGALALYLFEANGIDKKDVINKLIHETLRVFEIEKDKKIEYSSGVLNNKKLSKFNK